MQLEGATISQIGYCAQHITPQPVSCMKTPVVEDSNGGLLTSTFQDSTKTATSFRIQVGKAKKKGRLFSIPMNFSIMTPELLYECSSPTLSKGHLHLTCKFSCRSLTISFSIKGKTIKYLQFSFIGASWKIICKYSPREIPDQCFVSLSSFKRKTETNAVCSR